VAFGVGRFAVSKVVARVADEIAREPRAALLINRLSRKLQLGPTVQTPGSRVLVREPMRAVSRALVWNPHSNWYWLVDGLKETGTRCT
jgi:hypothetical protein